MDLTHAVARGGAVIIGLVLMAIIISTHFISGGIGNSLGNKIDHCVSFYLLCGRQPTRFLRYKPLFLGTEKLFPGATFDPTLDLTSTRCLGAATYGPTVVNRLRGSLWESDNPALPQGLPYARSIVRRCLSKAEASGATLPEDIGSRIVIHMRMSDVPFIRHSSYMLYPVSWYTAAVQSAQSLPCWPAATGGRPTGITIVSCFQHGLASEHHKAICIKLIETYQQALEKQFDLPTTHQCGSVMSDFRMLASAPVLIATPSSFSFYAGVTSDNYYITTSPWPHTLAALPALRPDGKLIALPADYIPHSAIKSYDDMEDIIAKVKAM
jgi:hypothetical protein